MPDGAVGVAVSGGSDSTALLVGLAEVLGGSGRTLCAATVDHGLRPGSAAESQAVAALCRDLGVPHATLHWQGWDGRGNLQDAARRARRALLADWAGTRGVAAVFLGHTLDDQAETLLLRLARGSGVDGLCGMAARSTALNRSWLRPFLALRRAELRAFLVDRGIGWAEDPSNDDLRFDRVKMRRMLPALEGAGLTAERLAGTAVAMARARAALEASADALAEAACDVHPVGAVSLDPAPYAAAPEDIRLRLLARLLGWVSGAEYRPRLEALAALDRAICAGAAGLRARTLQGCLVRAFRGRIWVIREPARTGPPVPAGQVWDGRWRCAIGPAGAEIGALGAPGLAALGDGWRTLGLPREALLSSPAIRRNGALIAAPFAKPGKECETVLISGPATVFGGAGPR